MTMLYGPLVCKIGGVKITQLCRLVKSGVGKTCTMGREMRCGKVEKGSREDMFLALFTDKLF